MNVEVYIEETPNPATRKFLVNKLLINGSIDFPTCEQAAQSPFARELYQHPFVKGVFIASNFVTITKDKGTTWLSVEPILKNSIKNLVEAELPIQVEEEKSTPFQGSKVEIKIQQILRDYVQPAVEQDGGAISYQSFENGVVTVALKGSCSGCPSSILTLKSGIENLLKRMVPEVKEVISESI